MRINRPHSKLGISKFTLIFFLLVLVGLSVGGWFFWQYWGPDIRYQFGWYKNVEKLDESQQADLEKLKNKESTPYEIFRALVTLGKTAHPIARHEAIRKARSEDKKIREGAAHALGYYDDPRAVAVLSDLLRDPEKNVRIHAIEGLGAKQGYRRIRALEKLIDSGKLSEHEKVMVHSSIYNAASSDGDRDDAVESLLKIAETPKHEFKTLAANRLMALAPEHESVIEMLKRQIEKEEDPNVVSNAIQHFASRRDDWLRDRIEKLSQNPEAQIRTQAIRSIHFVCPRERWEILKRTIQSEDNEKVLRAVISELLYLKSPVGVVFLKDMISAAEGGAYTKPILNHAKTTLAELEDEHSGMDHCRGR